MIIPAAWREFCLFWIPLPVSITAGGPSTNLNCPRRAEQTVPLKVNDWRRSSLGSIHETAYLGTASTAANTSVPCVSYSKSAMPSVCLFLKSAVDFQLVHRIPCYYILLHINDTWRSQSKIKCPGAGGLYGRPRGFDGRAEQGREVEAASGISVKPGKKVCKYSGRSTARGACQTLLLWISAPESCEIMCLWIALIINGYILLQGNYIQCKKRVL